MNMDSIITQISDKIEQIKTKVNELKEENEKLKAEIKQLKEKGEGDSDIQGLQNEIQQLERFELQILDKLNKIKLQESSTS